jgi:sugar lactone lactonase YvrE
MTFRAFRFQRLVPAIGCLAGIVAAGAARAATIYVSNAASNSIVTINSAGVGTLFASTGLSSPEGLAFDTAGNLYVANYNSNTVERFTPNGVGSAFASAGLNHPFGLAFDQQGNLFVANNGNNTIEEFTSTGIGSLFANTGLALPRGLAFDAAGNLYAANLSGNTIEKFTPSGTSSVFASGITDPFGLAFGPGGYLYVSQNTAQIAKVSPSGVRSSIPTSSVFRGIAFDSAGNLFGPVGSNTYLGEFTSGGVVSSLSASGLNSPQFIAIQVPEPSGCAIAGAGLAAFVALARRARM